MLNLDTFTTAYIEAALWSSTEYAYGECPCCGRIALLNKYPEPEFEQVAMCSSVGCGVREIPNPDPMDKNYSADDLAPETLERIQKDCAEFQERAGDLISSDNCLTKLSPWEQAGHDFWLTRCGHGAGFWETSDWEESAGEKLTAICKAMGSVDLYVGDDGKIYAS